VISASLQISLISSGGVCVKSYVDVMQHGNTSVCTKCASVAFDVCVYVLFIHTRISRNNLRTISGDRFSLDIVSAIAYIHTIMNRTEDVIATTSTRERM
jgi:hypothetical protein